MHSDAHGFFRESFSSSMFAFVFEDENENEDETRTQVSGQTLINTGLKPRC